MTTKQADILFSKLIRTRDPWCKKCGSNPSSDASHFIERGHSSVRYNCWNVDGMCRLCHTYFHAHPNEYRTWKMNQLGMQDYVALQRLGAMTMQRDIAILQFVNTLK